MCCLVDFAVPVDYSVNIKESKKIDKYFYVTRELKNKLWNMRVKVIPVMVGELRTVPNIQWKGLGELEIRWRIETIQTTAFLRLTIILRCVLKTLRDLQSLGRLWKSTNWLECDKLTLSELIQKIYIPTPSLGQDMTQGQFLRGV